MFEVKFADIGEGIHEGVIHKVVVHIGENIEDGDTLFLVETDKVTAEIPSPVSGEIKEINFKEGDTIHVGDVVMLIHTGDTTETEVKHEVVEEHGSTSVVGDLEISSQVIASSQEVHVEETKKKKVLATPVARKLAKDLGIDIQTIKGTGPAGRVMKADIYATSEVPKEEKVAKQPVEQKISGGVTEVKMTTIRKTIAEQMTKSKFTIPHTAMMDDVVVEALVDYRKEAKVLAEEKGVKLTYMPFIIKALTVALKQHPNMNASLDGDTILMKHDVHIGIAVDTPHGLVVPVIHHADQMSILEIASAIEDLSQRAQNKELKMEEIMGSTFSVTNYGVFGSRYGVPVINYPEAAILGVGKIRKEPVVMNDDIVIRHVLPLSMSFDHRIVDGADAGRFMMTLKALLADPQLLLLS